MNYFALLSRTTYDYLERTFIGIKLKRFRNKLLRFQVGKRQKRNIKCWSTLVDIQINGKLFWEFHPDNLKNNPNEILTNVDGYPIINPGGAATGKFAVREYFSLRIRQDLVDDSWLLFQVYHFNFQTGHSS